MDVMSLREIANTLGVSCDRDASVPDICTDTRKITKGCLFVALIGENFDGHDYVQEALESGAVAAVVQKKVKAGGLLFEVKSTEKAFQQIAGLYRSKYNVNMVGITGSIGKTTTREMVYAVLNYFDKTLKTEKNLNNQFGTPQMLLQLNSSYKNAVIEMGMSGLGEIEDLTMCVQPDIALITNIGVTHIELLGSRENILKAKLEIIKGLKENGKLVLCADDDLLYNRKSAFKQETFTYGLKNKEADVTAEDIKQNKDGVSFTICFKDKKYKAHLPIPGEHNVLNALGGFLVGVLSGYDPTACAKALSNYKTSGMRQNIVTKGSYTVIEDCYNAGPDSMKSSLKLLKTVADGGRTVAVLGDMLELGQLHEQMHQLVGKYVAENDIDFLLTTGDGGKIIVDSALQNGVKNSFWFESKAALSEELKKIVEDGDTLLFKASRGLKYEELITQFYGG